MAADQEVHPALPRVETRRGRRLRGAARQRGRGHRIGRKLDVQGCSLAGWAQDQDRAAEGLDPVSETDDAGATARVGAAYAVVADREGEGTVTGIHAHVDDRSPCVLGGVSDRLRRDVVTGCLDVLIKPRTEIQVEFDRHRGSPGECLQRRAEPGLRQQGRRKDPLAALSARERQVLALMAEGRSNAGIARRLFVTDGTVEKHISSILIKLNLHEADDDHRRVLAAITFLKAR
jgi:DNA-binding CsgD family transcriptional regulator